MNTNLITPISGYLYYRKPFEVSQVHQHDEASERMTNQKRTFAVLFNLTFLFCLLCVDMMANMTLYPSRLEINSLWLFRTPKKKTKLKERHNSPVNI